MNKRRYNIEDRDYLDEENYVMDTRRIKDKRKEKRFDRALKTLDVDALTAEEGLDPIDIEDEVWNDEWDNSREH
jgi:hypothetical protein